MPTQPNEGGRAPERRASDVLNPEHRAESADNLTRRRVLGMVSGGIAATAAVGTATASNRPTVTASSPDCGVLRLDYTDKGPTVSVSIVGPETYTVTLDRGESDTRDVAPGDYDVEARPAKANGGSSVPVNGSPVPVDECVTKGVMASYMNGGGMGVLTIDNPLDTCVAVRYETYRNGTRQSTGSDHVQSKNSKSFFLECEQNDEWLFWAHLPPTSGDCQDTSGDAILINDKPSPLRLEGSGCSSVTIADS